MNLNWTFISEPIHYYNNTLCSLVATVCSLEEVKKSKNEKYINKQVLKVYFAYYVALYWDF